MAAFESLKSNTGDTAILVMLVTSGLTHLPPMKVVTIMSGLVSFDLKWFILSAIVARGGRFYLLAYLLRRYGQAMAAFIEKRMAMIVLGVLAVAALVWIGLKVVG
jgi:membrane protein YqaA with SNARE-associated domain